MTSHPPPHHPWMDSLTGVQPTISGPIDFRKYIDFYTA